MPQAPCIICTAAAARAPQSCCRLIHIKSANQTSIGFSPSTTFLYSTSYTVDSICRQHI